MASRPLRPEDPRWLGAYQLLGRLGEGGMGTVFLGRDQAGNPVAVKAIRSDYADQEEFRARFRSEVNRVRQVPSFCTAAVLDADPAHATPYLVVEYVDGPSLREVISERGPMAVGDLHSLAVGVAAALTAIHGAGVIHRDLKPTNVLVTAGLPKVIDFGIARAMEATSRHTRTDQVFGTVSYLAPERLDSALGPTTPAADIFAWGAVVAYAGTGRAPFGGDSPAATVARILTMAPDLTGLPEPLARLVARALAKDPRARPTADELVQELLATGGASSAGQLESQLGNRFDARFDSRALLRQLIDAPAPAPASRRRATPGRGPGSPPSSRTTRRLLFAMVAALLVTLSAATVAYSWSGDRPEAAPPVAPPAGTAGAAVSPAAAPDLRGPSFFDPLKAPGRVRAGSGDTGSCAFDGGQLVARTRGPSTFQCPGRSDTFDGDQAISVDVSLADAGSCAMVWFRYRDGRGYQVTACADSVELEQAGGAVLVSVGRVPTTAVGPGARHKLSITIVGDHAAIAVDGALTLQAALADESLGSGQILLGVTNAGTSGNAEARFADLDVRTG